MKSLRILILNIDFPPDTSDTGKVVQSIAEALGQEHDVTVLAGRPFYDPTEPHPYYLRRKERIGNFFLERIGSTAFLRKSMLGRITNYSSYMLLSLLRGLTFKPDIVIAMTSPPLIGLVGAIVARVWRGSLVYNIRDLHPDMAVGARIVEPSPLVTLWDQVHKWVLRQSQIIIVLGEDMKDRVLEKGIDPARIAVVRNGAPPLDIPAISGDSVTEEVRGGFPFSILHAGNIGYAGAWDTILQAAERLEELPVGITFVGEGANRQFLQVCQLLPSMQEAYQKS